MGGERPTGSEIAVVGMACRFPGARDVSEFWHNLRQGVESIVPLSEDELRRSGVSGAELADPHYVRAAPILDGFDRFDASFFGYNALEARVMDPQQRLLLECSWQALEDAGYDPAAYRHPIGVYAGSKTNTYLFHLASRPEVLASMDFLQLVLGGDQAMLSTRVSYKLDLLGPSYAVQTACSTSLVAVHLACQSLLIDECRMALAGGVAVNVPHAVGYRFDEGGILSPDGHCRPFDAAAGGTVFGSGAGVVVLKRLEDAIADGDTVRALILGSATNNDGAKKANFTAPSVEGQTRVILEALACAGVDAESISYVEAHGTGTAVGDPMEILALSEAYGASTERRGFCAVGSVKSNVGHLDAAAGMSSLIKTVLALEHRELPPTLHYREPNPRIDFASSPFYVQAETAPWPGSGPRRAAVSSLGFGGTNAHLILEQAPAPSAVPAGRPAELLVLAARTPEALDAAGSRLGRHLAERPEHELADVAHTLAVGRRAFDHRRAVVCRGREEALELLAGGTPAGGWSGSGVAEGRRRPIFLFPGQGAQHVDMGRGLYREEPLFRRRVDRAAEILRPQLGGDLREVLYPAPEAREASAARLVETRWAQPALFVVELALARLWQSWGVHPRAMIGHSLGEIVAACLAGVFAEEEALALVAARGRLMQELPAGAMLAVAAAAEDVEPLLGDELALAAVNAPGRSVVSGPAAAVDELADRLNRRQVKARRLATSHAFHSSMMGPALKPFAELLRQGTLSAPEIPFASNTTGGWIRPEEATDPGYWARHLRSTVRFADGLATVLADPGAVLLEVGPGNTLTALARRHPAGRGTPRVTSLRHRDDPRPDLDVLLAGVGRLWLAGAEVDWPAFHGNRRRRLPLPTYPFERQRHWIDISGREPAAPGGSAPAVRGTPRRKDDVGEWFYRPSWQRSPAPPPAADGPSRWLLFGDDRGLGSALAGLLAAAGGEVVEVVAGEAFGEREDGSFTLDPAAPEDYARLLETLAGSRRPHGIVHLWSLAESEADADPLARCERQQERGFYSLLFLAQALAAERAPVRLEVVSAGVQPVTGDEPLHPERATVLGPCLVVPQEYPHVVCRHLDLEPGGGEALAAQAPLLAAELAAAPAAHRLAWRDGERWTASFETAAPPAAEAAPRLRQGAAVLVTGGLGLVGSTLAGELARSAGARLALVGRTALPERQTWEAFVAEQPEHPTSRKIATVLDLEAQGAEVLVLAADVTDEESMGRALAAARRHFGALHGVIHAAGEASGPAFQAIPGTDLETSERHFGVKVRGTLILDRLLAGEDLDFVLLNSSLSAVLGGLGNVAYAAANLFLDAFAAERNRRGSTPWISVDWDAWRDPGIGDPADDDPGEAAQVGATLVELAVEPAEGAEAFRRLLAAPEAGTWIVSTGDLGERFERWVSRPLRQAAAPAAAPGAGPPGGGLPALAAGELEGRIAEIWRQVLDLEEVGLTENFFDLGGDSLTGMQLVSELHRQLGVQVAPVTLFEAPTVRALAALLAPEICPPQTADPAAAPAVPATAAGDAVDDDAIAVVGMACRFPGAESVDAFWDNLRQGRESITFFTDDELAAAGVDPLLLADPAYVKARPVLADAECFDAALFGYSPREAERTDPQQRVFLELAWEALENAGHDPARHRGAIGVFGGSAISTYLFNLHAAGAIDPDDPLQTVVGNDKDALTTTVSYKLGLRGPSIGVQSFCSTSLVAVHLAAKSLRDGECDMALAGGVSVAVPQRRGYRFQEGGILSPDGHCRPFDAAAKGTLFGNGAGLVVLRRLADAVADGDRVHALVRGTAINNDGALKVGYTAPSVVGQSEVVTAALADAGVGADSIDYVEAHGTGTDLGDPVEVTALTRAFGGRAAPGRGEAPARCALGSVKGNVGHLDRAAGVASLIKTVLALEHGEIPPSLHYTAPNPQIDFGASPFYVPAELQEWPAEDRPRRAGVSALGFGGTNAHVIVEEAPAALRNDSASSDAAEGSRPPERRPPGRRPTDLLLLSAHTASALERAAARLADFLEEHPEVDLADVAYTLEVGRRELAHRRIVVGSDPAAAAAELRVPEPRATAVVEGAARPVVFLFPGQGAQYPGMGRELYDAEPVFRHHLDRCAELLTPHLEDDLRALIHPPPGAEAKAVGPRLAETRNTQPALFAVEYALARLWMEWGIEPAAMLGHSVGEYVAACLAGVFSLEDALALVAERGRLMQEMPRGWMLAVSLPEEEMAALLEDAGGDLSLAAVNARGRVVVAGEEGPVAELAVELDRRGIAHRKLHTSHAFHSAMFEPLVEPFTRRVGEVARRAPQRPFVSCLTGTWIDDAQAVDPAYWGSQLRRTVRFGAGADAILDWAPAPILLEVGPGTTLTRLLSGHLAARRGNAADAAATAVASMRHPQEERSDAAVLHQARGRLWLAGGSFDAAGVYRHAPRRRLPLPPYPFERRRFWVEAGGMAGLGAGRAPGGWLFAPSWKRSRPPAPRPPADPVPWLVLSDGGELAAALLRRLEADGQAGSGLPVSVALPGPGFATAGANTWTLRPGSGDDVDALLDALADRPPAIVLHLWSLPAAAPSADLDRQSFAAGLDLGLVSLLRLGRGLARGRGAASDDEPIRLWAISADGCEVTGDERGSPAAAPLAAACRALTAGCPGLVCRQVDLHLPPRLEGGPGERLVEQILTEVTSDAAELAVAWRGRHRWLPVHEAVAPSSPAVGEGDGPSAGSPAGTWLVTGGLEEPGFDLARCLARNGAGLVLLEPAALPPRQSWPRWLKEGAEPTPEELAASLAEERGETPALELDEIPARARRLAAELAVDTLPADFEPAVDALCAATVHRLFAARVDTAAGCSHRRGELAQALGVFPRHQRFFACLLEILAADDLVELAGDRVTFRPLPADLADPDRLRRELTERYPAFAAGASCLAHCAEHTAAVLAGELDPVAVLYPDGSSRMLEEVMAAQARYSITRIHQRLVAEIVGELAATSPRPLRLLEVQGGDGDLTWELAESLRGCPVEYRWSDPGRSFVLKARRTAAERGLDGMSFQAFDPARPPEPQGFEPYSFDVVVAVDAVHATERVVETLERLRRLVAPGGLLLLIEPARTQRWVTLIWGLLEDWWRFADLDLRPHSPILEPHRYEELLAGLDFASTNLLPLEEEARRSADHMLLVLRQAPVPRSDDFTAWAAVRHERRRQRVAQRIRRLSELESQGGEVRLAVAAPDDAAAVAAALDGRDPTAGGVEGVVHAAAGRPAAADLDPAAYAAVLEAARAGVAALESAFAPPDFAERPPRHAFLVSELAAAAGEAGYGPAAAADLFFARMAGPRHALGGVALPWQSVVWDLGVDGGAPELEAAALAHLLGQRGFARRGFARRGFARRGFARRGFAPRGSVRREPRVLVTRRPTAELAAAWNRPRPADEAAIAAEAEAEDGLGQPLSDDERRVAGIWREVLGVGRLEAGDSFFDLGGDSLIATQLHSRLRQVCGFEVPMEKLFEEPTVGGQARAIAELRREREEGRQEKLLARLAEMSEEEAAAELARAFAEPAGPAGETPAT